MTTEYYEQWTHEELMSMHGVECDECDDEERDIDCDEEEDVPVQCRRCYDTGCNDCLGCSY
jgi:hypothetical protein